MPSYVFRQKNNVKETFWQNTELTSHWNTWWCACKQI